MKKESIDRLLLVVAAFAEQALSFVLLLLAVATVAPVTVPGVTVLSKGGDKKPGFVLLIFHNDMFGFFDKNIYEK